MALYTLSMPVVHDVQRRGEGREKDEERIYNPRE